MDAAKLLPHFSTLEFVRDFTAGAIPAGPLNGQLGQGEQNHLPVRFIDLDFHLRLNHPRRAAIQMMMAPAMMASATRMNSALSTVILS
jgi:hypothetical protein